MRIHSTTKETHHYNIQLNFFGFFSGAKLLMHNWLLKGKLPENTKLLKCDLCLCANGMVYHIGVWATFCIFPDLAWKQSNTNCGVVGSLSMSRTLGFILDSCFNHPSFNCCVVLLSIRHYSIICLIGHSVFGNQNYHIFFYWMVLISVQVC